MKYAFTNGVVFTGQDVLHDKAVIIEDSRVSALVSPNELAPDLDVIDLQGRSLAPGFVDLQVNGGGGVLFGEETTEDALVRISRAHRRFGTTSLLPTILSAPKDRILEAIRVVRSLMGEPNLGILGLHLEGPFLNPRKAGAHNRAHIRKPTDQEIDWLVEAGAGVVKLITLAPEVVPDRMLRRLVDAGILVVAGHSEATYEQASAALGAGVSGVTHLWNAMPAPTARGPGLVGATLDSKSAWAGIIADGFHVHFALVRLAKRAMGKRLVLVSDAMPPVGADLAGFELGGRAIRVEGGRCTTQDGTLAGSTLALDAAVRNCLEKAGIPLPEALRMASTYPAEILGLEGRLGRIAPGAVANLVVLDAHLRVQGAAVAGEYERLSD